MAAGMRTASGVEMSKAQLVMLIVGGSMLVYYMYSAFPFKSKYHQHHYDSWKTHAFVDIPADVLNLAKTVKVVEKTASVQVGDNKISVNYRESETVPGAPLKQRPLVFLHGANEDGDMWVSDVGTLPLTAAMGYRSIALDLPGWGKSKGVLVNTKERGIFLVELFKQLSISEPVIVAASMGGSYGLPYLMNPKSDTCHQRAYGFVAMAIVGTEKYTASQFHRCHVPAVIVYGDKDTRIGLSSAGELRNLANNEIVTFTKTGHAAQREQKEQWHRVVYNFLIQTHA